MTRGFTAAFALALVASPLFAQDPGFKTTQSGLQYKDEKVGTGAEAGPGKEARVHYTGWLYQGGQKGQKFDSSRDRGEPFPFRVGEGQVIKGWDEGVAGMKVGGRRILIIPPELGYGARARAGSSRRTRRSCSTLSSCG